MTPRTCSIYLHIPFCTKKCHYCHFYVLPNSERLYEPLVEGLKLEYALRSPLIQDKSLVSLYFGGGTPSLLPLNYLEQLIRMIDPPSGTEITLEANPETLTEERLKALRSLGINRLSIGVQTLEDDLLKTIGRTHDSTKALEAILLAHHCGFDNLSVDLMIDLPTQSAAQVRQTAKRLTKLPISHLSLYNLTIEPNTLFGKREATLPRPSDDESLAMLGGAIETLLESGFERYEISAFARDGKRSVHNCGYWTGRPFIGLGPSAFSYIDGQRFRNVANLAKYVEELRAGRDPLDFEERLAPLESARERLAIELRLTEGVLLERYDRETESAIERLIEQGLLLSTGGRLRLTAQGMLFYDTVASELV